MAHPNFILFYVNSPAASVDFYRQIFLAILSKAQKPSLCSHSITV